MTIKIINPLDLPEWNSNIANLTGSTIFHTSNWARVLVESYGYQPNYFCMIDRGKLTGALPMMGIDSALTGKRGVSLPFSDLVDPLVDEQGGFAELFQTSCSFGRTAGWRTLMFHGGRDDFVKHPAHKAYIHSWIELDGSPQRLFKKLKSSNRRNIKKAEKFGVTVTMDRSLEGIKAFYRLNCLSRKDHGLPPQPFCFFKNIHEHIVKKGNGFVCLASINGMPVAGVVIFHFRNKAIYKYGASDKRFLHARPNNICMWGAIQQCFENGMRLFDMGRTDLDHHGLLQFKRSWNAEEKTIRYYKYDIRKQSFLMQKRNSTDFNKVFRQLPIPMLKVLGQVLYRHVG